MATAAAALVVLVAGALFVVPRLRRDLPAGAGPLPPAAADLAAAPSEAPPAAIDSVTMPAPAESVVTGTGTGAGAPAARDTAVAIPPTRVAVAAAAPAPTPPPVRVRPAAPAVVRPAPQTTPGTVPVTTTTAAVQQASPRVDTARLPVAAPPPVTSPAATPPPSPSPFGVDYPVVIVEGLAVVAVTREGEGGARRILVKQLLPSGDTLDLRASDLGEASMGVGVGRVLVTRHPSGGAMGTVRIGRYLVNARAPVAPEVLEPLLQKLVEKVPG